MDILAGALLFVASLAACGAVFGGLIALLYRLGKD